MRCHVFFKSCRWDDFCSAIFSLPYGVRWRSTTSKKERERAQRWGSRRKSRGQGASWNFMQFVLVLAMCFLVGLLWWVLPSFVWVLFERTVKKAHQIWANLLTKKPRKLSKKRYGCRSFFLKSNVADLFFRRVKMVRRCQRKWWCKRSS